MRDKSEAAPAGFAPWPISSARRSLILPTLVVQHLAEEEDKRKADEEEKRATAQASAEPAPTAQAPAPVKVHDLSDPPLAGFYRVLPRYSQLDEGSNASTTSVVDKEILDHRKALRERLLKAGPDRRLALPAGWRDLLDMLEEAQPNFSHPLRLVRNALAMADAVGKPVRIPPLLLLGPPGLGKTYFSHCLAEALEARAAI